MILFDILLKRKLSLNNLTKRNTFLVRKIQRSFNLVWKLNNHDTLYAAVNITHFFHPHANVGTYIYRLLNNCHEAIKSPINKDVDKISAC